MNAPIMHKIVPAGDNPIGDLRDQVALIAFDNLMSETAAEHLSHRSATMVDVIVKLHAKLAWDFADAFMRERYERESVLRALQEPKL